MKYLQLINITPENWRVRLKVKEEQKDYVSELHHILARAYTYRENRSKAYFIYHDDTVVGVCLYYDLPEYEAYDFSQILIDERYQGLGYGKEACKLVMEEMDRDGKYDKIVLCYREGNEVAGRLYHSLGFELTGEQDEDEIIMEKKIR